MSRGTTNQWVNSKSRKKHGSLLLKVAMKYWGVDHGSSDGTKTPSGSANALLLVLFVDLNFCVKRLEVRVAILDLLLFVPRRKCQIGILSVWLFVEDVVGTMGKENHGNLLFCEDLDLNIKMDACEAEAAAAEPT
eukprot:763471-Hanusia_phi.AAC.2